MHTVERISMWTVIALIIFFLFFKQSSGFTSNQTNLMSLAEFSGVPQPLKNAYVQNMTPIVNAVSQKITSDWNKMSPKDQKNILAQIAGASAQMVANINQAPDAKTAVNPAIHKNVTPLTMPSRPDSRPPPAPQTAPIQRYDSKPAPAPQTAPIQRYDSKPAPAPQTLKGFRWSDS